MPFQRIRFSSKTETYALLPIEIDAKVETWIGTIPAKTAQIPGLNSSAGSAARQHLK
jgi:hypothetical protein